MGQLILKEVEDAEQEAVPQLMRTRSDVGVRWRGNRCTRSEQRQIRGHCFSINGHFYNHKTSVFTPAYGSITNVRVNNTMSTPQVLKLVMNKFKTENSAEEFALYIVHTSGEKQKQKLEELDYPLTTRILQGPCELQGLPDGEGPGGRGDLRYLVHVREKICRNL